MTKGKALNGKPYAGNPHVWFDEGGVAPAGTPRRGSLLYNLLKMAGVAAVLALSGNVVADSCIVSGSTNRTEVVTCMAVAINSELDTRPAPEIRLDELNLRTDEVCGVIIIFQ